MPPRRRASEERDAHDWTAGRRTRRVRNRHGRPRRRAAGPRWPVPAGGTAARLRVAMLAPPWIRVPPPGYGGIESVVGCWRTGSCAAATRSRCSRRPVPVGRARRAAAGRRARTHRRDAVRGRPRRARLAVVDEAARRRRPFDVVHDHCGFTRAGDGRPHRRAGRAHGPRAVHGRHGRRSTPHTATRPGSSASAARSSTQRPTGAAIASASIPNPIDVDDWPLSAREGRLPAVDRPDDRGQGPAPRDRGRSRGRRAAGARRAGAARPGGVLRPRGRSRTSTATASATSARSAASASASCSPAPARC